MKIKDSKPILDCEIHLAAKQENHLDLLLDTGSEFGLLVKFKNSRLLSEGAQYNSIARGLNGNLDGAPIPYCKVKIQNIIFNATEPLMIRSSFQECASIGMDILRRYIIILNYVNGYVEFRKA